MMQLTKNENIIRSIKTQIETREKEELVENERRKSLEVPVNKTQNASMLRLKTP